MDGGCRIGIHTSIAGDIADSLEIAHQLGANTLQIFSSNPRMWVRHGSRLAAPEAEQFRERRRALGLGPLVIHDNYLINLASPEPVLRVRSVQAFHEEIIRAMALGADFLVAHPGSGRGADRGRAIATIAESLRQAARGLRLEALRILLENTAGQGTALGSRFDELQAIIGACPELPLGVCVDTAHLFAAGHDLRTEAGLERALEIIEGTVGLARVFVVHANDSKAPLGSRVDRHAHIGKGHIGLEGFRRILNHRLLAGRAFILETPLDRPGEDRRNVATLWKLVGESAQAARARDGFGMSRRRVAAKPTRRRRRGTRARPGRVQMKPRGR